MSGRKGEGKALLVAWCPGAVPYTYIGGLRRRSQRCVSEARNGACAAVMCPAGHGTFW